MMGYVDDPRAWAYTRGMTRALGVNLTKAVVQGWVDSVRAGIIAPVVQDLLTQHYDPVYLQSMKRNFVQFEKSKKIAPDDHSERAMGHLAQKIMAEEA